MNIANDSQNGQKVYVWIIATSTLLLIGLILWPLSVNQFRTTAIFKLKYEPASGVEKTLLNSWVVDALRMQTDRAEIAELLTGIECKMTSSVLNSMDPEVIRQALHIQGRPGSAANSVEYRLSLVGEGSPDEIAFINMIVARINAQLDARLTRDNHNQVVAKLTSDFEAFHDERLRQVGGQISAVMDQLTTADNDIRIVTSDLQSMVAGTGQQKVLGRPTAQELESLKAEKQRLLDQPGMTEYHPQVMAIREQIERLIVGQATTTPLPKTSQSFSVSAGNAQIISNRFASSSRTDSSSLDSEPAANEFAAPIDQILEDIAMIDLTATRHALADVQDTLDNLAGTEVMVKRLNERAIEQLDYHSPVSLTEFQLARRSAPMGGAPTTIQFLYLFVFAGAFGTVVAMNFDAALRKRPFRSVDQIQKKLSLPVIGVLRSRTHVAHRPLNKLLAARALRICEWTLLALAVLLILAALANSDVAAAFIENPFHGITQTIWLVSPNH